MSHRIIHGLLVRTNFMNLLFDLIDLLLVLDPRIMYEGLEEDFATDPDLLSHLATSKRQLQTFFDTNYVPRSRQSVSRQSSSTSVTSHSPQKVDFTSRYQKKDRVVVNELDEYFKLPREDFDTCEPLNWWRGRRSQFPTLYRLVCDIFSIPGKSCIHLLLGLHFLTGPT